MIYSDTILAQKVDILKTALDKSEALIIGAGAGLSATAGLAYYRRAVFQVRFRY